MGKKYFVELFIKKNAYLIDQQNIFGKTALHVGIKKKFFINTPI